MSKIKITILLDKQKYQHAVFTGWRAKVENFKAGMVLKTDTPQALVDAFESGEMKTPIIEDLLMEDVQEGK